MITAPTNPGTTGTDLGRRFADAFGEGAGDVAAAESTRYRRLAFGLFGVYMIVAVGIYLWRGIFFTPDKWAVFLLVAAVLLGRGPSFLRDWIPFVLLIFGYEYLRGIAGDIVVGGQRVWEVPREAMPEVRVENLIHADEVLFFGHSPIILLQDWLYNRNELHWWDFFALIMYSMHFVLPCVFAFVLWLTNKRRFWSFTLAFCFMTYVAFAFFLLYPAAPPWLAQTWGLVSGIGYPQNHVLDAIQPKGLGTIDTYAIWGNASPHPVAAMPSLHAGFPWLVMLFAVRYYGWKGLWFSLYNVALWFAVMYTANHWYVDVLAGMAWATVSFFVVTGALAWLGSNVRAPGGRRLMPEARTVGVPATYRLAVSVGPAIWVGDRSARHAWIDEALVWCGREGERAVWRQVSQPEAGVLAISGTADSALDDAWVAGTLHPGQVVLRWSDPVLNDISQRYPGLASYGDGSLFEGLITSIVGQSISVQSAAVTQRRLAYLFHDGIEIDGRSFAPLPSPGQLADASVELIRSSGVTTRRADGLKRIAQIAAEGGLPDDARARACPDEVERELMELPQVGPWTAISALLWGVGAPDAWPTGDVALLRAVKHAVGDDGLTLKTMDALAEPWRPNRGLAARLLWTNLFGAG